MFQIALEKSNMVFQEENRDLGFFDEGEVRLEKIL